MPRIITDLEYGTLGGSLSVGATAIIFDLAPGFPDVSAPRTITFALGDFTDPTLVELVHLTDYVAGATTGTILRAQEGTTALTHASGDEWRAVVTSADLAIPPAEAGLGLQHGRIIDKDGHYWTAGWGSSTSEAVGGHSILWPFWSSTTPSGVTGMDEHLNLRIATNLFGDGNYGCFWAIFDFDQETTLSWKEAFKQHNGTMTASTRVERRDFVLDGQILDSTTYTYASGPVTTATSESVVIPAGRHRVEFRLHAITNTGTAASNTGKLCIGDITLTPNTDPRPNTRWRDLQTQDVWLHKGGGSYERVKANGAAGDPSGHTALSTTGDLNVPFSTVVGHGAVAAYHPWYGEVYDAVAVGREAVSSSDGLSAGAHSGAYDAGVSLGAYALGQHPADIVIGAYAEAGKKGLIPSAPSGIAGGGAVNAGGTLAFGTYKYQIRHYDQHASSQQQITIITGESDNSVALTWTDGGAYPVRVYRRQYDANEGEAPWFFLDEVTAGTQAYTDLGKRGQPHVPERYGDMGEEYRVLIGYAASAGSGSEVVVLGSNSGSGTHSNVTVLGNNLTANAPDKLYGGSSSQVARFPGGLELGVASKTATYTVDTTDKQTVILMDATAGVRTVTLPAVVSGRMVVVKKTDSSANAVTVAPASGTIDGAANHALATQYDTVTVISDGANWFTI